MGGWGALRAITCFSGNYYCMKLVESFSAISVLAAVTCEVGQRGLKIHKKMRDVCWAFHS